MSFNLGINFVIYSLSQKCRHTLKYKNKIGTKNIWEKFILNFQNVIKIELSRSIITVLSEFFIQKIQLLLFVKKSLYQKFRPLC